MTEIAKKVRANNLTFSQFVNIGKSALSPLYFEYRSRRADFIHKLKSSEYSIRKKNDAPNHILVVIIDALRPDYTPDIDLEFTTAVTPAPWTFPAVTSIHTGLYPHEHGSVAHSRKGDKKYTIPAQASVTHHLPGAFEYLGYETGCFCGFLMPLLAVDGWYQTHRAYQHGHAERVINDYENWRNGKSRTFGYIHLSDLHEPLNPPERYEAQVDTSIPNLRTWNYTEDYDNSKQCRYYRESRLDLYEATLQYIEDHLRPLINRLRDDTVVLLTGDHGEAHWEHYQIDRQFSDSRPNYGVGHGGTPFDMVSRVPIACRIPDQGAVEIGPGWASLHDIPATLLDQVSPTVHFSGHSWSTDIPEDRWALCEGTRYGAERKAIYRDKVKIIRSLEDDITLESNVSRKEPGDKFASRISPMGKELAGILDEIWSEEEQTTGVNGMVQDQLEALGYK